MTYHRAEFRLKPQLIFMTFFVGSLITKAGWSAEKELPADASAEVLFWIAFVSLGFVWGAFNGLCLLALRQWRYQEAGYRWANAFWLGVAWAPLTFLFTRQIFAWWGGWTWDELSGGIMSLLFVTLITLNIAGVLLIGRWAARES